MPDFIRPIVDAVRRALGGAVSTAATVATSAARPNLDEVSADVGDTERGDAWLEELRPTQDEVLLEHGRGDLKLYERLLRDDQVYPAFRQRRDAVVARELKVEPGGDAPIDIEAADFIRDQIAKVSFDRVTYKMLAGIMYGRGIAECLFGIDGSRVVLKGIKVRRTSRFGTTNGGALVLLKSQGKPEPMPERKFWTYTCGADDDDDPHGRGLGHWLYWPVWFKRNSYRFWLLFLEIFSQPTPIGTHPSSWKKEQQDRFLAQLEGIRAGGRLAVPAGVKVDLVTAARDSGGDYNTFVTLLNGTISKIVLTQTMTTDEGSSHSQAKVHQDVANVAAKTDSDLLTESFVDGPVRWLVEWNFPGAKLPLVYRDFTEAEDLTALATRDQTLAQVGYRPTAKRIQETYGDGYEPVPTPAPGGAASFAETRSASDAIEEMMAGGEWRRVLGPEVARLEDLVEDAATLDEVRERLNELSLADPKQLTTSLAQLLFAARVGGNAEFEPDEPGTTR